MRQNAFGFMAALALGVVATVAGAGAAELPIKEISGFKAQLEHYPPPYLSQTKILLEAAKALPLSENKFAATDAKLTTFSTNGDLEMTASTPECLIDRTLGIVSSTNTLRIRSADGSFALEGRGFSLAQTNDVFTVSNQVHTTLGPSRLASQIAGSAASGRRTPVTSGPIDIFSDSFTYDPHANVAVYRDTVRVSGTNVHVAAGLLTLGLLPDNSLKDMIAERNVVMDLDEMHAEGGRALYTVSNDVLRLTGQPASWRMGQREGRGDDLVMDRAENVLQADGHASIKLSGLSSGTAGLFGTDNSARSPAAAVERSLEISSASYELRTNVAFFRDGVRAVELAGTNTAGRLASDDMTVFFSGSNQVQRANVRGHVVLEQDDSRIQGDEANFSGTNSVVEFTGQPSWKSGESEGHGDRLVLDRASKGMGVLGHATLKTPLQQSGMAGLAAGKVETNSTASGKGFLEISCEVYELHPGSGSFHGNVHVHGPGMTMNANELSTRSSLPGKPKSEWAQAAGNVSADFLMNGETNHATAELIVYDYSITNGVTNALVTLTGHPVVSNRNGDMHGDVITCDLIRNTIAFRNYGGSILLQKTNAPGLMDQFKTTKTNSATNAMNGERK